MTDQARFVVRRHGSVVVLEVTGEIDILNANELKSAMYGAAASDGGPFIISLTGVTYFDSQTLEALVGFWKRLDLARRHMCIVAERSSSARRLLDISALSSAIPVVETIEDAANVFQQKNA